MTKLPCDHMIEGPQPTCWVGRDIPHGCALCRQYIPGEDPTTTERQRAWDGIIASLAVPPGEYPHRAQREI